MSIKTKNFLAALSQVYTVKDNTTEASRKKCATHNLYYGRLTV